MASTQLSWTVTDASSRLFEVLVQMFKAGTKLISRFGTTELSMDLKSGVLTMRADVEVWRLAIAIASRFIKTDTMPQMENSRPDEDQENASAATHIATQTPDETLPSQHVLPNTAAPVESKTLPAPSLPLYKPTIYPAYLNAVDNACCHRNPSNPTSTEDDLSLRSRTPSRVRDNGLKFESVMHSDTLRGVSAYQRLDAPFRTTMYPDNSRPTNLSRVDDYHLNISADAERE